MGLLDGQIKHSLLAAAVVLSQTDNLAARRYGAARIVRCASILVVASDRGDMRIAFMLALSIGLFVMLASLAVADIRAGADNDRAKLKEQHRKVRPIVFAAAAVALAGAVGVFITNR